MTYQVLLQLFVVGNDPIVDDNKLWEKAVRVKWLDWGALGQKFSNKTHCMFFPDDPVLHFLIRRPWRWHNKANLQVQQVAVIQRMKQLK